MWQLDDQGLLVYFRAMGIPKVDRLLVVTDSIEEFQLEFERFQHEFSDIFDMPNGLPTMK